MKIHNMTQRSPEWFAVKNGVFSASEFGPFIIKNDVTSAKARRKLILEKIKDANPKDAWQLEMEAKEEKQFEYNIPVQRGNALEPEARRYYESRTGYKVREVGFVTHDDGGFGASPDGLIPYMDGFRHGLEIKCPMPEKHLAYLLEGTLPEEYKFQVHGSMAVTGLDRWDFLSYCPGEASLLIEVRRDAFTEQLLIGLKSLVQEKREIKARLHKLWDDDIDAELIRRHHNHEKP
jgi:putative phage-type endonuclease